MLILFVGFLYYLIHSALKNRKENISELETSIDVDASSVKPMQKSDSMIKYILNTHRHEDHFNNDTLEILKTNGVEVFDFEEEEQKNIGKYKIKAVKANHPVPTLHYIISDRKNRIFYGLDGAWLMYNEVQAIKEEKVDFAIFDATIGFIDGDYRIFEHNNLNMVLEMKKTLLPYIDRFCISHMARTLHDEHKVLEEQMRKHDVEVAFDGMEIVI